tara:strand:+ start:281 stop:1282 length:1002 start_codon:yes stop_codon:yes gene_type:complete
MAFVAVLPAAGTVLGGLGAAASAIPIIGPTLGALGGGLGGAAGALSSIPTAGLASGLGGALSSLGSGVLGGLGGLYTGADKLLGGFLPNLGGGIGITPQAGFLGQKGLGLIGGPGQFLGGPAIENMAGGMGIDDYVAKEMALNPTLPTGGTGLGTSDSLMPKSGGLFGGIKDTFKDMKGAYEASGLKDVVDAGKFIQGAYDAYQYGDVGPNPYARTPAGAAQRPSDAPGVIPIPSRGTGAVTGVSLAPGRSPNPFRASSNLMQNLPGAQTLPASPNVERRLAKLDEPFMGSDIADLLQKGAEAEKEEEAYKAGYAGALQDSLGRNAMSISGSF